MSVTSEEINYLIWRYLQETGHELTSLALQEETRVLEFDDQYKQHIPIGTLVNLIQKGILYSECELLVNVFDKNENNLGKNSIKEKLQLKPFDEQFNLVNALKLDKIPELAMKGRFALRHDEIELRNENNANNNEEANSADIDTKSNDNKTQNDIFTNKPLISHETYSLYSINDTIISQWNSKDPYMLATGFINSTARIYKFKMNETNDKFLIDQTFELKHPFITDFTDLTSNDDPLHNKNTTQNTTNRVTCLQWSHDGKNLITCVENGEIRLWNNNGELQNVFNFHKTSIISCKWNNDDNIFITLDINNIAILWNVHTGTILQHFELTNTNNSTVESTNSQIDINGIDLEWVDNDKFVLPSGKGMISVYDIYDKQNIGKLVGHKQMITCIKFNQSSRMLATSADDFNIRIWVGNSNNSNYCFMGHSQNIIALDWINKDLLISSSMDGTVRIWSIFNKRLIGLANDINGNPIIIGTLSPNKLKYSVVLSSGEIRIFNIKRFIETYNKNSTKFRNGDNDFVEVSDDIDIDVDDIDTIDTTLVETIPEYKNNINEILGISTNEKYGNIADDKESSNDDKKNNNNNNDARIIDMNWNSSSNQISISYSFGSGQIVNI